MENKINVAELLKDCPTGMELDCTMYDNVILDRVDIDDTYSIRITTKCGFSTRLTRYGQNVNIEDAKCVIFPKGKTTWEGFQRPFKDGDVVYNRFQDTIGIVVYGKDNFLYKICDVSKKGLWYNEGSTIAIVQKDYRLATEEEKQKLFQAIKDNGYCWNFHAKRLEKLIIPNFKKGDKVRVKNGVSEHRIIEDVCNTFYTLVPIGTIDFTDQDRWELVPNKFDITTLKPFTEVLVRYDKDDPWMTAHFSHYTAEWELPYFASGTCFRQCIPYKGNEHLRGTTNDCEDFYKTWK